MSSFVGYYKPEILDLNTVEVTKKSKSDVRP